MPTLFNLKPTNQHTCSHFLKHIGEINFDFVQTCEEAYHSSHNGEANTSYSEDEELDADHQQPEIDKHGNYQMPPLKLV